MSLLSRDPNETEKAAEGYVTGADASEQQSTPTANYDHSSADDALKKEINDNNGSINTRTSHEQKESNGTVIGPNTTVRGYKGESEGKVAEEKVNEQEEVVTSTRDEKKEDYIEEARETNDAKEEQTAENTVENDAEDETKYPGGFKLAVLTFGLCMALFVVALDNTIIATAIPRITTVFDSLDDVGWYGSSYLLTTTSLQPSFGKVYTYMDVKYTYLLALVIFELGSILCAAATSSKMLIIGRAVAGAGAAALFSGGMTIIGFAVPLRRRPFYIALLSSMFGISSIVGPILGGALTDHVTWRWCFWINLPFGGVAIAVVAIFFQNPTRRHTEMSIKQKIAEVDLVGAFFLICAIVCLLLALQWGGTTYPWHDSKVWGCILGFGLILSVFLVHQTWRGKTFDFCS